MTSDESPYPNSDLQNTTGRDGQTALEDLVARITPENRHSEITWNDPQGREVW